MKKIVIIANKNPFKFSGGVEFVCKMLAEKLSNKFKIYVICNGYATIKYDISSITVFENKFSNIPVIQDFDYALKIRKTVDHIKPNLVIDNGCISFLNNTKRHKTISIAHGTNYGVFLSHKNLVKKIYKLYWSIIQYFYLNKVSNVVVVSKYIKKEVHKFYKIPNDNIKVIDNGTYIIKDKVNKIQKYKKQCIFVSNDHSRKGIAIIEKLANYYDKIKFIICGSDYKSNVKNIIYRGSLSSKKLDLEMEKSDFLICPSSYEGQSLVVLDAMASGLPVILSKQADPGIIENGNNGYICDNNDINTYLRSIDKLYSDIDKFNEIRKNNIQLMQNYTWDIQIQKYYEFIKSIIN